MNKVVVYSLIAVLIVFSIVLTITKLILYKSKSKKVNKLKRYTYNGK